MLTGTAQSDEKCVFFTGSEKHSLKFQVYCFVPFSEKRCFSADIIFTAVTCMGFGSVPAPAANASAEKADSGFRKLDEAERCAALRVLKGLAPVMEDFLDFWTQRMQRSGYLSFTPARRADCLASCETFLAPILQHDREGFNPTFEKLHDQSGEWSRELIAMGMRHRRRGVHGGLFLSCFKNFVLALEDALRLLPHRESAFSRMDCDHAVTLVHIYAAAFEVLWLEACMEKIDEIETYENMFRMLTLEKCRFENILNATSDCVLVMDDGCRVTTANRSLCRHAGEDVIGRHIWDVLGLEGRSPQEFFRRHPIGRIVEVAPFGDDLVFRLSISSMDSVNSAGSLEYLVLLTNITPHVLERRIMEKAIRRHTADLVQEKERLEEMNLTLCNVLGNVKKNHDRDGNEPAGNLLRFLGPALTRLCENADPSHQAAHAQLIREQAEHILADSGAALRRLTLSELKVCRLIQEGCTSKEAADILNISPETVQTHRKNIRRKLGVKGRGEQLSVFLMAARNRHD